MIIAEAGVNHNGKLDLAYQLCDAAREAGVDAVKFQTWKTEKIIIPSTPMASYQQTNTGAHGKSQFEMLKELELGYEEFEKIQLYCQKIGILFLSTPVDPESLNFLVDRLHMPIIKVSSGDLTNIHFLRLVGEKHLPVILSTGMGTLAQTAVAYDTLQQAGAGEITLLHCTTNYPCPYNEVNLRAMLTLRDAFHCSVGYSDHTMGIEIPIAATALGASVIEKHFTLSHTLPGPDHAASLEPQNLKRMVTAIKNVTEAMGDGIKRPNRSEIEISKVVLKRIVPSHPISKGSVLTAEDLLLKRASDGLTAKDWDLAIGATVTHDLESDQPLRLSDLSFNES